MDSDAEEITLPTLPASEPSLPLGPPSTISYNRKRPFLRSREQSSLDEELAEVISTSSDPALFSNDETPDAENYSGGVKRRRKRTYRGTWWDVKLRKESSSLSETVPVPTRKRSFRRNIDSGIFMADDSSATDLSSEGWLEQELLDAQERESNGKKLWDANSIPTANDHGSKPRRSSNFPTERVLKRMPISRTVNPKDDLVMNEVKRCLDRNDESVDLIGLELTHLPASVIDLKSMIKRIQPGMQRHNLAPFEAELKLYLANNNFEKIPRCLLELTNIQLLSLRQNNLTYFPEGIRALVNLRELNISSNNLQYLPYEVMELFWSHKLAALHFSPNPWMPLPPEKDRLDTLITSVLLFDKKPTFTRWVVSRPIEFCANGTTKSSNEPSKINKTQPHLSEMVLRALLRHNISGVDLSSYLSEEHPFPVRELIATLHTVQSSGGRTCAFCRRDIILPRYQWYEWWDVTSDPRIQADISAVNEEAIQEVLIPFQRMGCGCIDAETGLLNEKWERAFLRFRHRRAPADGTEPDKNKDESSE